MTINFKNAYIDVSINLEPFFEINKFRDLSTGNDILTSGTGCLTADRKIFSKAKLLSNDQNGNSYKIQWAFDGIKLTRNLFFYDNAPAVRWYDTYESENNFSGMYYSTLSKINLLGKHDNAQIINWYSCTDQSNHRELKSLANAGKNIGGYFITDSLFFYKEGPMPDCQPIKGEYDFLYEPEMSTIEMLGLGFDNLRKGEVRRANGVVIGLTGNFGMQRYNLERYKEYPSQREAVTVMSNSWPDLELGISEDAIEKELHAAAKAGVNVVFIDDGWFEPYMGPIDEKKFPNKFTRLAEIAKGYNIEIGLWVNPLCLDLEDPRMVLWSGFDNKDLMKEESEFNWMGRTTDYFPTFISFPRTEFPCYSIADIMIEDCFNYMKDYISGMFRDYKVRHFKFDCYQLSNQNTRLGDANIHYEKYRELCAEIQKEVPDLVISFDVTRSNRPNFNFALDYGRLFLENRGRYIDDHRYYHPYMALGNTWYTMKYVHGRQLETEMMPQAMDYDLEYILGTTIFSTPLYWGSIDNTPTERQAGMKDFYQKLAPVRKKMADYICLPLGEMPGKGSWSAVAAIAPDSSEGYVAIYRNGATSDKYTLTLPFGSKLEKVFGDGEAAISNGQVELTQGKDFSCSFYRFV